MTQKFPSGDGEYDQSIHDVSVVSSQNVTFNQTQIIQISVEEIKTRKFIVTSPYKGLKKFESEDKDRFFGRDQFLTGLVNELEQTNFVLLLGASGSGKSSVIRAGLIPWLVERQGSQLMNLVFTPDQDPFESLYASLLGNYKQSEAKIARVVKEDTLTQVVRSLKQQDSYWFILIDQFEELFTTTEPSKRDVFIKSLVQLVKTLDKVSDRSVKVVATMRADFLDRLSPYANLIKVTDQHRPIIAEMQLDELRLAIEQPAAHHGVVFEAGLVKQIIDDVQGQAGYLPLLQYTLNLLWETEVQSQSIEDRTLNISNYRQLGGVRGALQLHIDQIYGALSEPEKLAAQRIFLKLVSIGEDEESGTEWKPVRRRANRPEFSDSLEQTVLMELINQNLLVSNRATDSPESTIEIAHEALLISWTTLNTWIKENRQAITLRNRLNDDVEQWKKTKSPEDLWRGSKLERILELSRDLGFNRVLGGFSPVANQFINASKKLRDRQLRRTKIIAIVGFVLSGLATTAAIVATYQFQQAERGRMEQYAATAEALLANEQPVEALINSIAGVGLSKKWFVKFPNHPVPVSVQSSLLDTVRMNREENRLHHETGVTVVRVSKDGNYLATGDREGTIRLWDLHGHLIGQPLQHGQQSVEALAFSPDRQLLISGSEDGTLMRWNLEGKPIAIPFKDRHQGIVASIAFSSDGLQIASGGADTTVRLWDRQGNPINPFIVNEGYSINSVSFALNSNQILFCYGRRLGFWTLGNSLGEPLALESGMSPFSYNCVFSPDGSRIATSGSETVKLWNLEGKSIAILQGHQGYVSAVGFSSDNQKIVSGGADKTVRVWDLQGNQIGLPLRGHQRFITSVDFVSKDKQIVVSGSDDGSVRLWNLRDQSVGLVLSAGDKLVTAVAVSPNGKYFVTGSQEGMLHLWNANGSSIGTPFKGHQQEVTSVAFSPDNQTIVSGSLDQSVRLWHLNGSKIGQPLQHDAPVTSVAFSPDGKLIASGVFSRSEKDFKGRDGELWTGGNHTITLSNLQGKRIAPPFTGHYGSQASNNDKLMSVAFSLDGKYLVS
ncbi:NACHT and WD repeat domain-containing protein, partial [Anabaena sp. PCC 7938]